MVATGAVAEPVRFVAPAQIPGRGDETGTHERAARHQRHRPVVRGAAADAAPHPEGRRGRGGDRRTEDGRIGGGDDDGLVPAVVPFEHITITVWVPEPTSDQAADCPEPVPDRATWRPGEKFDWSLPSRDAVPQPPLCWAHAVVVPETVEPVVLTKTPGPEEAGPVSARGSATAAATVSPERGRGFEQRM
ncbi:hypothetical protein GCM10027162_20210 [Streptomyces incanus]